MKKVAGFFASLAFAGLYQGCLSSHPDPMQGLVSCVVCLIVAGVCASIADQTTGTDRDLKTAAIVKEAMAGGNPYFYLYLRPFISTKHLPSSNPEAIPVQDTFRTPRSQDIERILSDALEKWATPLVALGRPGEMVGAGRYKTDDDNWMAIFEKLALAANGIVMIPSTRTGTLTEAKFLKANGLIEKSLFIYPGQRYSEPWAEITNAYAEFGVLLPPTPPLFDGALIKITDDGELLGTAPIATLWAENGGSVVQSLKRLKKSSSPAHHRSSES